MRFNNLRREQTEMQEKKTAGCMHGNRTRHHRPREQGPAIDRGANDQQSTEALFPTSPPAPLRPCVSATWPTCSQLQRRAAMLRPPLPSLQSRNSNCFVARNSSFAQSSIAVGLPLPALRAAWFALVRVRILLVCLLACLRACMRACLRVCLLTRVLARLLARLPARLPACLSACLRACCLTRVLA